MLFSTYRVVQLILAVPARILMATFWHLTQRIAFIENKFFPEWIILAQFIISLPITTFARPSPRKPFARFNMMVKVVLLHRNKAVSVCWSVV
jgi:hypothetical protein